MTYNGENSNLTDPKYCVREAQRLMIPVTEENWDLVSDDAGALNILQAAVTHLIYADAEREHFQEQLLQTVFTAYLMGRAAGAVKLDRVPEEFRALIETLDLSALDR